jgi:hypothetical protein
MLALVMRCGQFVLYGQADPGRRRAIGSVGCPTARLQQIGREPDRHRGAQPWHVPMARRPSSSAQSTVQCDARCRKTPQAAEHSELSAISTGGRPAHHQPVAASDRHTRHCRIQDQLELTVLRLWRINYAITLRSWEIASNDFTEPVCAVEVAATLLWLDRTKRGGGGETPGARAVGCRHSGQITR